MLVKSDTVLPMVCHHCDIFSEKAVLLRRNGAAMGPANSLDHLAYYSKYNQRFDLIYYELIESLNFDRPI